MKILEKKEEEKRKRERQKMKGEAEKERRKKRKKVIKEEREKMNNFFLKHFCSYRCKDGTVLFMSVKYYSI